MDIFKSYVEDLLLTESRRIDKELEKGPIKYKDQLIAKGKREEGLPKTYKVGNASKKYGFFQTGELVFKPFFDESIVKLAKQYKEEKITKDEFRKAVLKKVVAAGDAFEKSEEKDIYTNLLNTHMYFLVDAIVEVLLGKPAKEFKDIIKTGEEIKATVKKIKPETFKSFVKHYKIVEHLIDIIMVDPYEIEKRLVRMELED